MPLEDYLPRVKDELTRRGADPVLSSIEHSLEAYQSAITRADWKGSRRGPAVRSALNAIAAACSKEEAKGVLTGALGGLIKEVQEVQGCWDKDKFKKYNPGNVGYIKTLEGEGGAEKIYVMKSEVDSKRGAIDRAFKPDTDGYAVKMNGRPVQKPPAAPGMMGIDDFGSRLSARSVASYKVDKMLGTRVLARTRFAECTVEGEQGVLFGSLQNWTGGRSLFDIKEKEGGPDALKKVYANPKVVEQLQHLQLVDYLTGQTDRHAKNIHIVGGDKVLGIDHDFSFPSKDMREFIANDEVKNHGLPKYVSKHVKTAILEMEPSELKRRIGPYLSVNEIDRTIIRLTELKEALKSDQIKQVDNWPELVANGSGLNFTNSYLYSGQDHLDKTMKNATLPPPSQTSAQGGSGAAASAAGSI